MSPAIRLSLAGVVAVLAAGVALGPLSVDRTYLFLALLLMLASTGVGAIARHATTSELAVRIAQLLPVGLLAWLIPDTRDPIGLIEETVGFVLESAAPMQYDVGVSVLSALLLWGLYLVVESLAVGVGAVAWTFPVLFTPYLITALIGYLEAGPLLFCLPAAGYGLLLAIDARNALRPDRATGPAGGRATDGAEQVSGLSWRTAATRAALATTAGAITLSVLAGFAVPERYRAWPAPAGPGAVQLSDPSLDLIRNLNSSSDAPVITYRTSSAEGEYLRLAALPVLDPTGFHLSATELVGLPPREVVDRRLGAQEVRTTVEVAGFASEYLPVPWVPVAVEVAGRWNYDPRTLAIVALGDGRRTATQDTSYTVTSARLPSADRLLPRLQTPGTPDDAGVTLQLPPGLSEEVYDLVDEITDDTGSAGERALAIRDYLRSGRFTYSTAAAPGTTLDTLNDFLVGSRIGYCEQFAGAMAVLARIAQVPSRVVIGFLPGRQVGDAWQVSPRNMHAWTELYFGEGVGWVAVDATPAGSVSRQESPSASPTPSPTIPSTSPSAAASSSAATAAPDEAGSGGWALELLWWGLLAAAVGALVVAGPNAARMLRRRRRLVGATAGLEDAWDELRALATDRGVAWPPGSSRAVAAVIAPDLPEPARAEFERLALHVELDRYSAQPVPADDLPARVLVIERGMKQRWAQPAARFDRWWPRSLRTR